MRPSFAVPPVPQVFFSFVAISFNWSPVSGRSETTVTPFPLRPAVSRLTLTVWTFFGGAGGGDGGERGVVAAAKQSGEQLVHLALNVRGPESLDAAFPILDAKAGLIDAHNHRHVAAKIGVAAGANFPRQPDPASGGGKRGRRDPPFAESTAANKIVLGSRAMSIN